MSILLKVKRLINQKKQTLKIIGIILLYLGTVIAFFIAIKGRTKTEEVVSSPTPSDLNSPLSTSSGYPEISIPPQPTYKPVIKSPSPTAKPTISPSPSSSPSLSQEPSSSPSSNPSPSPSPPPQVSPSLSPSPSPIISPSPSPELNPSPSPS